MTNNYDKQTEDLVSAVKNLRKVYQSTPSVRPRERISGNYPGIRKPLRKKGLDGCCTLFPHLPETHCISGSSAGLGTFR